MTFYAVGTLFLHLCTYSVHHFLPRHFNTFYHLLHAYCPPHNLTLLLPAHYHHTMLASCCRPLHCTPACHCHATHHTCLPFTWNPAFLPPPPLHTMHALLCLAILENYHTYTGDCTHCTPASACHCLPPLPSCCYCTPAYTLPPPFTTTTPPTTILPIYGLNLALTDRVQGQVPRANGGGLAGLGGGGYPPLSILLLPYLLACVCALPLPYIHMPSLPSFFLPASIYSIFCFCVPSNLVPALYYALMSPAIFSILSAFLSSRALPAFVPHLSTFTYLHIYSAFYCLSCCCVLAFCLPMLLLLFSPSHASPSACLALLMLPSPTAFSPCKRLLCSCHHASPSACACPSTASVPACAMSLYATFVHAFTCMYACYTCWAACRLAYPSSVPQGSGTSWWKDRAHCTHWKGDGPPASSMGLKNRDWDKDLLLFLCLPPAFFLLPCASAASLPSLCLSSCLLCLVNPAFATPALAPAAC